MRDQDKDKMIILHLPVPAVSDLGTFWMGDCIWTVVLNKPSVSLFCEFASYLFEYIYNPDI